MEEKEFEQLLEASSNISTNITDNYIRILKEKHKYDNIKFSIIICIFIIFMFALLFYM